MPPAIIPLSPETQVQIKSSVQITSITDVILELIKNSLDAHASVVQVQVDFAKGFCSVQDDGEGINQKEFAEGGGLAKLYFTSKTEPGNAHYGQYGRFLASLAGVSLLSITSRHRDQGSASCLVLNESGRLTSSTNISEQEHSLGYHGTKITVYNLFGKLPVRVKHRVTRFEQVVEVDKAFRCLKMNLVALILASPRRFKLDVREASRDRKYIHKPQQDMNNLGDSDIDLMHICSTLTQAGSIDKPDVRCWKTGAIHSNSVSVNVAVSLRPVPSKSMQYLSFGRFPASSQRSVPFFDIVNELFDQSDFGALENTDGLAFEPTIKQSKMRNENRNEIVLHQSSGKRKEIERWPMFYLQVNIRSAEALAKVNEDMSPHLESNHILAIAVDLTKSLIMEFLDANGFRSSMTKKPGRAHRDRQLNSFESHVPSPVDSRSSSPFDRWNRVKFSHDFPADDLLHGLPFRHKDSVNPNKTKTQQTLINHDEGSELTQSETQISSESSADPDQEIPISWTNPQNGQTLLLNPRTGAVLPSRQTDLGNKMGDDIQGGFQQPASNVIRGTSSRRKRSPAEIARSLDKYNTPSFSQKELPIRSIAFVQTLDLGDTENTSERNQIESFFRDEPSTLEAQLLRSESKVTRDGLERTTVLGQIDSKFILARVTSPSSHSKCQTSGNLLVLIDQHAADERFKVEGLYTSLCNDTATTLALPLIFEVGSVEAHKLQEVRGYFANWHCLYNVSSSSNQGPSKKLKKGHSGSHANNEFQVRVTALPTVIAERCRLEPKLVIDMLRTEAWSGEEHRSQLPLQGGHQLSEKAAANNSHSWIKQISRIPTKLLDIINSRACRSAIMFNDPLSISQCQELVIRLSRCALPFQCAHGRPSMLVLANLSLDDEIFGHPTTGGNGNLDTGTPHINLDATGNQHTFGNGTTTTKFGYTQSSTTRLDQDTGVARSFGKAFKEWTAAAAAEGGGGTAAAGKRP